MARVKLENIYKVYEGGVRAVNDFNLDIPDKEFVVFVGPSGCGKSTTLRMIAGLEDITQGKLYIDDQIVNDVDSKNRDIAMVFQNYALYPHMTVYQNMAFGLKLRHTPKAEIDARVKKAAEILEISELLSRKPKALSGGQRQRVALGRAIVREPKVFLLDEPLSNLDAKLRVQMRSEITKLHEKLKTTFIYVTHDQTEAMTMGTRIVVMKDGFIQQVDSPVALFEEPANLFVATFLGSPQMNILSAKLELEKNKMIAILTDCASNPKVEFSDTQRKQIINDSYFGKEVKFGIRPEAITVDPKGQIDAVIDVAEQLGDETILYCAVEGLKQNIVVKTPFKGRVVTKEKVKLFIDMNKVHLFDKDSTNSILGMRPENRFDAKITNNEIIIGKNKASLPQSLKQKLLPSAFNNDVVICAKVDDFSFEEIEDSIKLPIFVEFTEQKTDYLSAYFKVDGLNDYFVLKINNDSKTIPNCVYLPIKKLSILDKEGEILNSREVLYQNELKGVISKKNDQYYLKLNNKSIKLHKNYENLIGKVRVVINPVGPQVVFNKKLNKENEEHNKNINGCFSVKAYAYDEYKSLKTNYIYVKAKGFENYATFVVKNDFSVYKMPTFNIIIPEESLMIFKDE